MSRHAFGILGLALLLAASAGTAHAAVICVSPVGGGCETTVQAGVDAALAGDTARIDAGLYEENVVVPLGKDGLVRKNKTKDTNFGQLIEVDKSPGGTITIDGNKGTRMASGGIDLDGDGWSVTDNKMVQTSRPQGCLRVQGNDADVGGNKCVKSWQGFTLQGDNNTLTDNQVKKGLGNGFDVQVGTGNTLQDNKAQQNVGVGITIRLAATGTTVEDNNASGNREDFCDAGTATSVSGNAFGSEFDPMGGECPAGPNS